MNPPTLFRLLRVAAGFRQREVAVDFKVKSIVQWEDRYGPGPPIKHFEGLCRLYGVRPELVRRLGKSRPVADVDKVEVFDALYRLEAEGLP